MGTPAQDVDAYFGDDTYDWTAELARRTRLARGKYDTFVKRHFGIYDDGLSFRLELLEQIAADVDAAFTRVRTRQAVDRNQFRAVLELFQTASDCVEFEIEQLEGIFGLGLATALTPFVRMFPFRELATELKFYEQALTGLQAALDRAKRARTEARVDKAIDVFQAFVSIAFPEIALAKEIALGAGGLFADSRLGPQGPDASKITRTTATTLKEPLSKLLKLSKSMDKFAGYGSQLNAVYDVFDTGELDAADAAIKDVERAIANEQATHKRIVENIWMKWRARVLMFISNLDRANRELEQSAERLATMRQALREQRDMIRYRPPTIWRAAA